ncbi:hypothetical protein ACFVYA_13600 [Amycolatopsis sp. NPDC058278]|uniref:hypothetical protein n=1 Tax=Amycolatopsis sp. NPDC058278 TaxID=3346417 RepID=UPI0036DBCEF0
MSEPDAVVAAHVQRALALRGAYAKTGDRASISGALAEWREALRKSEPGINLRYLVAIRIEAGTAALRLAQHDRSAAEVPHLLAEAVAGLRHAVDLAPDVASHARAATNLGAALRERGEPIDLADACDLLVPVVATASLPRDLLAMAATNLGHAAVDRYCIDGEIRRLDTVEAAYGKAVELTEVKAESLGRRRAHLAVVGIERFLAGAGKDHLAGSIALLEAARKGPGGREPVVLTNLAVALRELFEVTGDKQVLDRAAALLLERRAAEPDDLDGNLRAVLARRAEVFGGDASDLRAFASAAPVRATMRRSAALVNRAAEALEVYDATGRVACLEQAITDYRAAVEVTPTRSPRFPDRLADLASALRERARRLNRPDDLHEAVDLLTAAADAEPQESPDAGRRRAALALVALEQVRWAGKAEWLETAVQAARAALGSTEPEAPDLPSRLGLLGACLLESGRRRADPSLVDEAVAMHRRALAALGADDPARFRFRQNLGDALCVRNRDDDHPDGVNLLRGVLSEATDPATAVAAARNWCTAAIRRCEWPSVAEAAVRGLGVVATLVDDQQARPHREGWLRDAQALPASGAYALSKLNRLAAAVAVLEGGRAVLLSRALRAADGD